MRTTIILLSSILLLTGCLIESDERLPDPIAVSAEQIKSVDIVGTTIAFRVVCMVPEPCWKFVRFEDSMSEQTITTTVFAQRTTNGPCLQVISSIEAPVTLEVPSGGVYTFRFWRRDETTLDTTLTIP
jgi:hypothetical protein